MAKFQYMFDTRIIDYLTLRKHAAIVRYMLDANTITDIICNPYGKAASYIRNVGESSISVSAIVAAKLYRCSALDDSRQAEMLKMISRIAVMPFGFDAEQQRDRIRAKLQNTGHYLEQSDLLLAAHASSLDIQLVTDRLNQFSCVPGLKLENWLA